MQVKHTKYSQAEHMISKIGKIQSSWIQHDDMATDQDFILKLQTRSIMYFRKNAYRKHNIHFINCWIIPKLGADDLYFGLEPQQIVY